MSYELMVRSKVPIHRNIGVVNGDLCFRIDLIEIFYPPLQPEQQN